MSKKHRRNRRGKPRQPKAVDSPSTSVQAPKENEESMLSRRHLLILGGATAALAAWWTMSIDEEEESEKSPSPETIERIDKKIEAVEAGFAKFGERLIPLIDTLEDEYLKALLKIPFTLVSHNAAVNKERNVHRLAKNRGHGTDDYSIQVYTSQFFYDFEEKDFSKSAASFHPASRKMVLSDSFDPDGLVDNLVLFHELMHVYHDSKVREKLKTAEHWQAYNEFYLHEVGEATKLNILDEAGAIARELEALNLLLDGELQRTIESGGAINYREIMVKMGVKRQGQSGPLAFTLDCAKFYFADPARNRNQLPRPFMDFIAEKARKHGYEVVKSDGLGRVVPYK